MAIQGSARGIHLNRVRCRRRSGAALGGIVVSLFALLGDALKPKMFAGLLGAAPSVALASIFLTIRKDGVGFAAVEARSMILGAVAFFVYAWCAGRLLLSGKRSALTVTAAGLAIWGVSAFALWQVFLG
jgi:hypothetical protein